MTILERRNEFNRRFEQRLFNIEQLMSAYDALDLALRDAAILNEHYDDMDDNTHSAFSRAFITSYTKPFTSDKQAEGEAMMSGKYLTKHKDFDNDLHNAIIDLRNTSVAHKGRDTQDTRIFVAEAKANIRGGKPSVGRVCAPYAFWYKDTTFAKFEKGKTLDRIVNQTTIARQLTADEIKKKTLELQQFMLEYADVCDRDARVIILEEGEAIPSMDDTEKVFGRSLPNNKFAKRAIVYRTATVRERGMETIEYDGDEFSITQKGGEEEGKISLNVVFKNVTPDKTRNDKTNKES